MECGFDDDVQALLAWAHGRALRQLSRRLNFEYEGLTVAARAARRAKLIGDKMAKRLEKLDVSFHVVCHVSWPKVRGFVKDLMQEMQGPRRLGRGRGRPQRVWVHGGLERFSQEGLQRGHFL